MIRLFVGLALPDSMRSRLHTLAAGIPGARWIEPSAYHITLRFIGEVHENMAADIHVALTMVRRAPFALAVIGVGVFDQGSRIHSLWAGVARVPSLLTLRGKVERVMVRQAGLAPETRRYAPHITLARLRGAPTAKVQAFLAENNPFHTDSFTVDHFVLYSTHQASSGAFYTPIADYPLDTSRNLP
ncbi:MAG: 2'-5' RNA ligase [Rhodospirillaceae bacterium]|nr:MAG: 2'-5' RNA ligase [Rhodospirillaceae bacterium]